MKRRMGLALPLLVVSSCICGCFTQSEGNASWFLTYGTTLEIGTRTEVADPKQVARTTLNADKLFGMVQAFYASGPVDPKPAETGP